MQVVYGKHKRFSPWQTLKVAIFKLVNSLKGVSLRRLRHLHPEIAQQYYGRTVVIKLFCGLQMQLFAASARRVISLQE